MRLGAGSGPDPGVNIFPCKFIGFGAIDITKPYKFIGFGAIAITNPYKFIGFGARDFHVGLNRNWEQSGRATGSGKLARLSYRP